MSPDWETFLSSVDNRLVRQKSANQVPADLISQPTVSALSFLTVLKITGTDAAAFLQGQVTCDILGLKRTTVTPGSMCNPKGRALTNFLLLPVTKGFLLILPKELAATIKNRLSMYVLRSDVTLVDAESDYCLIGVSNIEKKDGELVSPIDLPSLVHRVSTIDDLISFKVDDHRWIVVAKPGDAINCWESLVKQDQLTETSTVIWRLHDILSGFPWLSMTTTELFVPQMFNLDCQGGISFSKGCYTGQEIIARTHYLGKQKRRMYLASCKSKNEMNAGDSIYVLDTQQSIGQVINAARYNHNEIRLLAVLQIEHSDSENIVLGEASNVPVKIETLPYTF